MTPRTETTKAAWPTNRDLTILHTLRSPDVVWVWTGDATSMPSLPFAASETEKPTQ